MGQKLNNRELIETYDYDRKNEEGSDMNRYVFRNEIGEYLEVVLYDADRSWIFLLVDSSEMVYQHNLPYYNEGEFERDLKRMGIPVPPYKVKRRSESGFLVKGDDKWVVKWSDCHAFGQGWLWNYTEIDPNEDILKDESLLNNEEKVLFNFKDIKGSLRFVCVDVIKKI